ncbi:MAG: DNA polymerase III subunit beta [Desulfatibacillaceae bacterium]
MQFSIKKSAFLDGITKVQGITSRKTTFPITANVLIHAADNGVTIEATDLETGFSGFYGAEVQNPGTTTLPGRKLHEILREFPSDTVKVQELENGWIEIFDEKVQYHIVGMDPNDFPELPEFDDERLFPMEAAAFADMGEKANLPGGMSSEEKRPHLIGLLFERITPQDEPACMKNPILAPPEEKNLLRLVATDGHRLAKVDYIVDADQEVPELGPEGSVILPKKSLGEIINLVEDESGEPVRLGVQGNYLIAKRANETVICRLIEGTYPDYSLVVPQQLDNRFRIDKKLFLSTLRRMSILSSDKYRAVRFKVTPTLLTVSITNPELGESKEELPIDFDGESFEVAFNPKFFVDAMGQMNSEVITVRIESEKKACILEGEHDPAYLTVIMPMRM